MIAAEMSSAIEKAVAAERQRCLAAVAEAREAAERAARIAPGLATAAAMSRGDLASCAAIERLIKNE